MKMKSGFSPDSSENLFIHIQFLDCKIVMDKDLQRMGGDFMDSRKFRF
jgi:hypothetical protein